MNLRNLPSLTADRKRVKVARNSGINAFDVEKEGEKIKDFIELRN